MSPVAQSGFPAEIEYSASGVHPKFIIVGGGKMGAAIVAGLIASQSPAAQNISACDFLVVNPGQARRDFLTDTYGVECVADVSNIAESEFIQSFEQSHEQPCEQPCGQSLEQPCEQSASPKTTDPRNHNALCETPLIVVLAVKPQIIFDVIADMAELPIFQGGEKGPLFVSVAAGITIESLAQALPDNSTIVRVMPNMPLVIGAGATGICVDATSNASQEMMPLVKDLFDCLGKAVVVDEDSLDVVCALSGSGPAYVAKMIETLTEAGKNLDLSEDLAQTLAIQTVLGTALLLDEGAYSPTELREAVSSPGGTTLAALDALEENGFALSLCEGVVAAVQRSKELASGK